MTYFPFLHLFDGVYLRRSGHRCSSFLIVTTGTCTFQELNYLRGRVDIERSKIKMKDCRLRLTLLLEKNSRRIY